jgi:hypothetical protein
MTLRLPSWAFNDFESRGQDRVCANCLMTIQRQDSQTRGWDLPPRIQFGRGWFTVCATHWLGATDAKVFPPRHQRRLLAQTVYAALRKRRLNVPDHGKSEPTRPGQMDRGALRLH